MTKKELVLSCINHENLGVIPYDVFEGWMWPGIASKLMKEMNVSGFEEMLDKMGVYCRWLTPYYSGPSLPVNAKSRIASPHTMHSLNSCIWGLNPMTPEHGMASKGHPLAEASTVDEIFNYQWPSTEWFDYETLNKEAQKNKGSFVIVGGFSPLFYLISELCGMEKTLINLYDNPEIIDALVNCITSFYKGYFSKIIDKCKNNIDAIALGDDFSSQSAMLMSPELWRKHFKPTWRELFKLVKDNGIKVMFHSCGSVFKVIPDLIEAGLDILYPVQPKAKDMDIVNLKINFGNEISFYGGLDVQELLPFGRPTEIQNEVKKLSELFKKDGGFILSSSHVIMEDIPIENVIAMYRQAGSLI